MKRNPRERGSVEHRAAHEGRQWAAAMRQSLSAQQRRAAGGWPGTVSEARARVAQFVLPRVERRGQPATNAEREQAARVLYASARAAWLEEQDPEEIEDEAESP